LLKLNHLLPSLGSRIMQLLNFQQSIAWIFNFVIV